MKRLAKLGPLLAGLFFLGACSDDLSQAPDIRLEPQVTFGTPDGNDHPYVGTLLFVQNGEGYYSCTGTLLSSTVMLTAAHCVEEAGNVNNVTYVSFSEEALEGRENYTSTQEWLDAEWILAEQVIPHPDYEGTYPDTYDVGLVILPEGEAVVMDTYGELPELGLLERLVSGKNRKDRLFTAVGYGMQGYINPFYSDEYARYKTTTSLIEINSTFTGNDQSAKFSNNPGKGDGSGGTCYGDSGGPIFHGDTNVIGAITSWGITPCIGVDYNFRIDTAIAQDFIMEYLE